MKAKELRDDIETMLMDMEFEYKGVSGAICPFSQEEIAVKYGNFEATFDSVDALMDATFIDGKPFKEVCPHISF